MRKTSFHFGHGRQDVSMLRAHRQEQTRENYVPEVQGENDGSLAFAIYLNVLMSRLSSLIKPFLVL